MAQKVAQQIQEHAHEQEEVKELYRETIDENIFCIL